MLNFQQTMLFLEGKDSGGEERGRCPVQRSELWLYITHSKIVGLKHYKATQTTQHMQTKIWAACSSPLTYRRLLEQKATEDVSSTGHPAASLWEKKFETLLNRNRKRPFFSPGSPPAPHTRSKWKRNKPIALQMQKRQLLASWKAS